MSGKTFPRLPIHEQITAEEVVKGLRLRRVRLSKEQHAQHVGNQCWGVPVTNPGPLRFANVLVLEVRDGPELCSVVVLTNRNVDAEKAFDVSSDFPDEFWTRGFVDTDPVSSTSWRITGWQDPNQKNPGKNIQLPLEPGLTADMAWQRVVRAAEAGLIRRG